MRCPKCGYITFDHLETCLKCNKDISSLALATRGTTYHVESPPYLKFEKNLDDTEPGAGGAVPEEDVLDVVDPDLDILADTFEDEAIAQEEDDASAAEPEIEIELGEDFSFDEPEGAPEAEAEPEIEIQFDGDELGLSANDLDTGLGEQEEPAGGEEELTIDFNQFEDADDADDGELSLDGDLSLDDDLSLDGDLSLDDDDFSMEVPEELADLSDLEAPDDDMAVLDLAEDDDDLSMGLDTPAETDGAPDDLTMDIEDLNLDLDGLDEELTLDDTGGDDGFGSLSLDDIDLSETVSESLEGKDSEEVDDMDADLNFDLDLGGLKLDDD